MFSELFNMPIAYDLGINITTIRKRKHSRKGVYSKRHNELCETVVITSKEMSEISAQALMEVFNKVELCTNS